MTIAQAFNEITIAQGGTPSTGGTITGAIDALNDTLAGSDQPSANTIEGAIRLLGAHIGGGVAPSGTIEITENGEGIDVAQYAYADVNVSGGGGGDFSTATVTLQAAEGYTEPLELTCACITSDDGLPVSTNTSVYTENASAEFTAILYKGKALAHPVGFGINITTSGNVEYDPAIMTYTITGDCTFTFSN